MERKTIGITLMHVVCCGLVIALALGGISFLTQNWWFLVITAMLLVASFYLLRTKRK